jgi:hypothetical protein
LSGKLAHIEKLFPSLEKSGYSKSSERTPEYNCFAFAVYDTGQFWQKLPVKGYYWPLDRDDRLEDWIGALGLNNFKPTDNWDLEPGFEKVCIYVNDSGSPEHVARQLESGKWTSKIGKLEDIQHDTLGGLEGTEYGTPKVILKRRRFIKK